MTYLTEALADSPLALWMCDETSGTTAADSSGNARHLTVNGAVTLGAATVMPTGTSAFSYPNAATAFLRRTSEAWMQVPSYTITAWVDGTTLSSYRGIWSRDSSTRGPSFYATSGKLNLFVNSDSLGTATLTAATAYFVAATYDSATSTLKYYINGALDATYTSVSKPNTAANAIIIGASQAGVSPPSAASFPWHGRIGPVGYFPSALSATRMLAQYNAGIGSGGVATTIEAASHSWTALDLSVPTGTDTSNRDGARRRGGIGLVTVDVPVAPVPPTRTRAARVTKAVPLPTPTMVDGRPT